MEAHFSLGLERAERIKKALQPVSAGDNSNKQKKGGLSDARKAQVVADFKRTFIKVKKTAQERQK